MNREKLKTLRSRFLADKDQQGINMVDLMMWLVIAALLLAAAIQGIGYYQKSATLYSMKNDASNAASAAMARMSSEDGTISDATVTAATNETTKTSGVTTVAETGSSDADGFVIRSTSDSVTDSDVVFLSAQRGSYDPGVHIVPKGTVIAADGTTTVIDPSDGGSSGSDPNDIDGDTIPNSSDPDIDGDGTANVSDPDVDGDDTLNALDPTPNGELPALAGQPSIDKSAVMTTVWDTRLQTDANYNTMNWQTVNMVPCTTISLPLGQVVDATIDWGDGSPVQTVKSDYNSTAISHTYSGTPGIRTVKVTGQFGAWVGADWTKWTEGCITEVTSWGDGTGTLDGMAGFNGAVNLKDVARIPLTMTNLDNFLSAKSAAFTGANLNNWDVSNVTDMSGMFADMKGITGDISNWDVSNVEWMASIFSNSNFNGDISNWDVSKVRQFNSAFAGSSFNGDISGWNPASATQMQSMFNGAEAFNQDLSGWNVSSVTLYNGFGDGSGLTPEHRPAFG